MCELRKYAIDLGFGRIKGINEEGVCLAIPTYCKKFTPNVDQDLSNFKYVVKINQRTYKVGEFAAISNAEKSLDREQQLDNEKLRVYLGTMLTLLSDSTEETENITLAMGLPISFYKEQKDELKDTLLNLEIETELNGRTKVFVIKEVLVSQQAVAAFESVFIDISGNEKEITSVDKKFYKYGGGIIDIGFNTMIAARIKVGEDGFFVEDDESMTYEKQGSVKALEIATDDINEDLSAGFSSVEIENAIKKDFSLLINGKEYSIKSYIDNAYRSLADEVKTKISSLWKNMNTFGALYMVGGTSIELVKYLRFNGIEVKLIEDPIFANVKGLMSKLSRKYKSDEAESINEVATEGNEEK